jgi:hypothetical protein
MNTNADLSNLDNMSLGEKEALHSQLCGEGNMRAGWIVLVSMSK